VKPLQRASRCARSQLKLATTAVCPYGVVSATIPALSRTCERRPSAPTSEAGAKRCATRATQHAAFARGFQRLERAGRVHRNPCLRQQRERARLQRALLDDPRERPLARAHTRRSAAARPRSPSTDHRLDGRDTIGGQRIPRAERTQERDAAGTDRVHAGIPVVASARRRRLRSRAHGRRAQRSVRRRERRRERQPDEPGAGDERRRNPWRRRGRRIARPSVAMSGRDDAEARYPSSVSITRF
jgi:hypothetical protein